MFDQVKIDLDKLMAPLRSLATSWQEGVEATKLEPVWAPVSKFWTADPPKNMLSIFVKLPSTGEKLQAVANLFINMILSFSCSLSCKHHPYLRQQKYSKPHQR